LTIQVGDIVKRNSTYKYYQTIGCNDRMEVLEIKESGSGTMLMRLKKKHNKDRMYNFSETTWFSTDYFEVVEERSVVNGKNDIFLVFSMLTSEDNAYKINFDASAVQFSSEKEAKEAVAQRLEVNPETVWGIFPLAYLVKVEKPPVKFTTVWKR
jgi:hypothetical protein